MTVQPFPQDWRLPGCGEACRPRQHDPEAHEAWGERVGAMRAAPQIVRTGPLAVDLTARTATVAGADLPLTGTQWRMVELLVRNLDLIVPPDRMMVALWGRADAMTPRRLTSMGMHVRRLRTALGPAGRLLVTVRGRGYRLELAP